MKTYSCSMEKHLSMLLVKVDWSIPRRLSPKQELELPGEKELTNQGSNTTNNITFFYWKIFWWSVCLCCSMCGIWTMGEGSTSDNWNFISSEREVLLCNIQWQEIWSWREDFLFQLTHGCWLVLRAGRQAAHPAGAAPRGDQVPEEEGAQKLLAGQHFHRTIEKLGFEKKIFYYEKPYFLPFYQVSFWLGVAYFNISCPRVVFFIIVRILPRSNF